MIRTSALAIFLCFPIAAFAADSDPAPKPTETTTACKGTKVWDKKTKACVNPKQSSLDADTLYDAARELAYAGRYNDAIGVLDAMPDQQSDKVLTYRGFTARMLGRVDEANSYYQAALDQNPDNLLARSYMAQGFVASGDKPAAIAQLREIRARGGAGSIAETSLLKVLKTGRGYGA